MFEWIDIELGEFIELKRGYDLPKNNRKEGTVPLVSSAGKSDFHNIAKVKGPGVVTGRYGTIGQVFYVEEDFWPLNTTLYVKDFKGNDPLFIYYFLKTISYSDYSDKAAVPGINRNHLHKAKIKVPKDSVYQRTLAEKLWALDQQIELNRQTNQTLEQIAQALFKSWFVDFDPVKAKIAAKQAGGNAEQIERAAMSAISGKTEAELDQLTPEQIQNLKTTAALFPDELVDSELGEIPEGWNYKNSVDVADVSIGKTPPRKEPKWFSVSPSDIRWVSIRDMGVSGTYIQNTNEFLTEEAIQKFNLQRVPNNTVLLSFKLTVGRVAISDGEMVSNEAIAHFKLNEQSMVNTEYLYLCLKLFDYDVLGSTSSIATAVNSKMIKSMPILVPSKDIIDEFYKFINPIFEEVRNLLSNSQNLTTLRDALLPKLLAGEID